MAEFLNLLTPEAFLQTMCQNLKLKDRLTEKISFMESLGRIVAEDIISPVDLPDFTRSTVDGFAVRAVDTIGVSETLPGYLEVIGEVLMGEESLIELNSGQAVKIATGGMLPMGSDGVLMVEYTDYLDSRTIEFSKPVAKGENLVLQGDDIQKGEILLPKGQYIRPQDIGALAGLGLTEVLVYRRLEIALLSTGDELVSPYAELAKGQVRDINSYSLAAELQLMGCKVRLLGIVEDSPEKLKKELEKNLDTDLILISGGSSVGVKDMTVDVLNSLGKPGVLVHGVSIKPGKPTILAVVGQLPIIGLPGHPTSAWTIFYRLVKPFIRVLQGEMNFLEMQTRGMKKIKGVLQAVLSRNLVSDRGKEQYVPVRVIFDKKIGYIAEPILGKSSLITTLVRAHGFIRIDIFSEGLNQGQQVEVELF